MPFIEVIQHEQAEGQLKDIYDNLVKTRGKLAEVHKIQSLNPESINHHMDLYLGIMFGKSPLKRYQREMIAVIVSVSNSCEYCQLHHAEALLHYWKDQGRIDSLKADFKDAELDEADVLLCKYAQELTANPSGDFELITSKMKEVGLSDRQILDANLVTAYFNFVNRIVIGLGVVPDEAEIKGYNY